VACYVPGLEIFDFFLWDFHLDSAKSHKNPFYIGV